MTRWSIRQRVTLWNTAGFAIVLLGFGLAVYGLLRKTHYDQLDRGLRNRVVELQRDVANAGLPAAVADWSARLEQHYNLLTQVFDANGNVIAAAEKIVAAKEAMPAPATITTEQSTSLVIEGLGHYRRFATQADLAGQPHRIVIFKDLAHIDEEMGQVITSLLVTTPIAIGLAAALAYLLARKALAPVEQLRQATNEITAVQLHRRLSIGNQHDEIGGLAQTINAMIERLERSFDEIQRFTADASHELRTPIAVIRSESEMGLDALSAEDVQNRFGSILEECARLAWTTDQLLTLAREDAGIALPATESVDLATLAREVVETMRPFAGSKEQSLLVSGDETAIVHGDAERLRQVLRNLLANAIKYTPSGGEITVSLVRSGAEIAAMIRDTGIGIAGEHLPRIFDRFYRVDHGRSQQDGGAGLGLSIVKSIVSAHGGRIEAESTLGKGTVFMISFPVA